MDTSTEDRRTPAYWISAWLPVAIAIAVIAVESTSYLGADHTSQPLRWIYQHLFGALDAIVRPVVRTVNVKYSSKKIPLDFLALLDSFCKQSRGISGYNGYVVYS